MAGENAALKAGAPTGEGVDNTRPEAGVTRIVDADEGLLEFYQKDGTTPIRNYALCGFASTTRDLAPFTDPAWAIVGMNQLNRFIPHAEAWFEIHKEFMEAVVPGTDHRGFLRDCGIPILMTDRVPDLPTSVRFPIARLIAKFGDYFTSTVAHMAAYFIDHIDRQVEARMRAISAQTENGPISAYDLAQLQRSLYAEYGLGFYGIDLVVGEEYAWQRPCAEYYLGQALARNITVYIPKPSALLKQRYRYGYEMQPNDLISDFDLERRRVGLVNEHQKTSESLIKLTGALEELAFWTELRTLRERGAEVGR